MFSKLDLGCSVKLVVSASKEALGSITGAGLIIFVHCRTIYSYAITK